MEGEVTSNSVSSSNAAFTPQEVDSMLKYFVGNVYRYREQIIIPRTVGPVQIKSPDEKRVEAAFESCAFKSFVATVMGILTSNISFSLEFYSP